MRVILILGLVLLAVCAARVATRGDLTPNTLTGLAAGTIMTIAGLLGIFGPGLVNRISCGKERSMSALRLFAIVLIFAAVSIAWMVLGGTVMYRTESLDSQLAGEMKSLWGPAVLTQGSPYVAGSPSAGRSDAASIAPSASDLQAAIRHNHRYKGLLWYSTFEVDFQARYVVAAAPGATGKGYFIFPLPRGVTQYPKLEVLLDEKPVAVREGDIAAGRLAIELTRDAEHVVTVDYITRGQDYWLYSPGEAPEGACRGGEDVFTASGPLSRVSKFSLTVTTDFADIDYPKGTSSPNKPAETVPGGRRAVWTYDSALTNQAMGIAMPRKLNAGPIAARMSFFAPVSLLFFFTVLFTVVVLKGLRLHPMHFLFIAGGFFAFHILLAYLADLLNIHVAFWICAAVSVLLVVTYMRLVAGVKFAVLYSGLAQLVYLVGFAYAFFWEGRTGLTVTIGAILTLFVLMQATGRVKWHEVFSRNGGSSQPTAIPPLPPKDAA